MRFVHMRFGKIGWIAGDQWQITGIGKVNQRRFRRFLHRIAAPCEFNIQPPRKQRLQSVRQRLRMNGLSFGKQARQPAFTRAGQRDQAIGEAFKIAQLYVRIEFQRTIKVRLADQMAEVVIPRFILRIERQVIDQTPFRIARHAQQGADNRLNTFVKARLGEHDRTIQPVAVSNGDGGKPSLLRQLRHTLGLNRPFKH